MTSKKRQVTSDKKNREYLSLISYPLSLALGFTLVELLIVLSIISILITLATVSYRGAQVRARDTQRLSDLRQYQNSLEIYANENGSLYPYHATAVTASSTLCSDLGVLNCPEDPRPPSAGISYKYYSNGAGVAGTPSAYSYVMYAELESTEDFFVVCSDGRSGKIPATSSITPPGCPL